VIECLSECVEFFAGAFDSANPRKGGEFKLIDEKKWDGTPEDENRHDVTDEIAAYRLANVPFPGLFGVYFENDRPTKNAFERKWIETTRAKLGAPTDLEVLQKTFDRMK
jgi:2-oxoglutarate/2-oxoacid ferredoxin oxidoreductase subunit beta